MSVDPNGYPWPVTRPMTTPPDDPRADEGLVEAMARAMYAADEGIVAEANEAHINAWFGPNKVGDGDWPEDYRVMARAALTAARSHRGM